jgi:hypothetical protein
MLIYLGKGKRAIFIILSCDQGIQGGTPWLPYDEIMKIAGKRS